MLLQKISIPPPQRGYGGAINRYYNYWKFRELKVKDFKGKYEPKLEFPEEWGIQTQKPSMGGVWIFSGTTRFKKSINVVFNHYLSKGSLLSILV